MVRGEHELLSLWSHDYFMASFQGRADGKVGLVPGNYLDIIEPLSSEDDNSSSEVGTILVMC